MSDPPPPAAATETPRPYLAGLNEGQRQAVEAIDGPVLVLAGAGTGKTRVLTTRLAHVLATRRAWPSQILAVTFTNKAALEMRERLERMIGEAAEGLWLGTFHSIGARILRRHAEGVGLKSNFTILDADDQLRLVKQLAQAEGVDDKRWPARMLLGAFERWKDRGLIPDKVPAGERGDLANGRGLKLYRQYQERLVTLNAADFGDLLLHNLTIFAERADILAEYQKRFHYILVDEYQDTNVAQYLWLRLLAQGHRNLCCVGDDDQSIYSWRGAEIGNILRFERDFPSARIVRLEQNYRSTPHILAAASGLIAHNEGRLGKTLWTAVNEGERIVLRGLWDGPEEARWVGDAIEARQRQGERLSEIAILVRASFQTREFEERFLTLGLPYRVIGGPRFYERQEIRDALAYLRLIHQPADDLAFERIVNLPRRGIGGATLQSLHGVARAADIPLAEAAARLVETDEVKPAARQALRDFLATLSRWRGLAQTAAHTDLAGIVLDESGYTAMWQADKSPDAPSRLENLKELVEAMAEFENLAGFLEHVSLVMETTRGSAGDMVSLMTLHGAKGLEFDTVFLPGWEEGLFPNQRAMQETGRAALEEERRLAYVGLTRARHRAYVSYAANRSIHGQWQATLPSRFLAELPGAHVEVVADPGLYPRSTVFDRQDWSKATPRPDLAHLGPLGRRAPLMERQPAPRGGRELRHAGGFSAGDRIFHQKFGYGTVRTVDHNKLAITFDKAGDKMVMDSFVERATE
ncbi:MAG TPA: UvrD-helicase domain-containing protein [Stellaceae bacterium]|jgi:DNA helicase-2/ATP-dependent DNA helicase PcrA|nr:UvrD-helicase domain-containing protein [Stellaceae bacterium]